jgi:ABC-type nitrate/sulfonate/bicarbonate transport system substrate-binding protein
MKTLGIVALLLFFAFEAKAVANPYLPKAGERPTALRIATSAVTGGFVHFYAGLDYGIFEKYGLKCEHIYIRGRSPALAALANDQVQFNYGAADGSLPGLAASVDAKFVASPLVKLPYVMVARKEIRRPEDLKGKSIGVTRPGDLSARLSRQVVRKFGLTTDDVTIRPIGGSKPGATKPWSAMSFKQSSSLRGTFRIWPTRHSSLWQREDRRDFFDLRNLCLAVYKRPVFGIESAA